MSVDLIKSNTKFDSKSFNADFVKANEEKKAQETKRDLDKLNAMNTVINEKKIGEMNVIELLHEWQYSIVGIINDLVHLRFTPETFTKDNRAFFFGVTIIIVCIFFFLFYEMFKSKKNQSKTTTENNFNISLNIPEKHKSLFTKYTNFIETMTNQLKKTPE